MCVTENNMGRYVECELTQYTLEEGTIHIVQYDGHFAVVTL